MFYNINGNKLLQTLYIFLSNTCEPLMCQKNDVILSNGITNKAQIPLKSISIYFNSNKNS